MWASGWGHLQVVERILAAGAQPDRITSECTQVQRLLKGNYIRCVCLQCNICALIRNTSPH